ncbi:MAG: DUF4424 family protein [Alphaproteobacteria bacterium]|nr:DUF4424 family protein [Alphaproteobacteria bacterium]MBL7097908.1 DUF4424 family protein [Alphaproteobacteria bacterium]
MKRLLLAATALTALALTPSALADDSSATLDAGGIVLTRNADIRMATEDLYISPKQVKVHYTFTNDSGKDIDTIVAFPLPDVDNYELAESPIGTTTQKTPNFVNFRLMVDGKPVATTPEERAVLNGRDVTDQVTAAGLPLNIVIQDGAYDKLQKLPKALADKLRKAGLIEGDASTGEVVHAKWKTLTRFWWKMHFPAGKTVGVDHSYTPVTGQSFFSDSEINTPDKDYDSTRIYCMDSGTKTAILKLIKSLAGKNLGNGTLLNAYRTDFIIRTANNWSGPIGRFHLTIDKMRPASVMSMCWNGDLRKTGATTFESTLTNFAPKQDIKFLVVELPNAQTNGPGGY